MEDIETIKEKANWCLNCKAKPCSTNGCPMQTNIPEFIEKIRLGEYENAYKILINNNIFSHICSLVCPQEEQCEGNCVRGIKQIPTSIGELEKFVNEWASQNNIEYKISIKPKNGKRVAIIGSGPAGLECAVELLKNGYDVTIFEKDENLGGILWYGIPDFRLPKILVKKVIEKVKNLGAEIKSNTEFGKNIDLKQLQQNYDYIFIGIGASQSTIYSLGKEELEYIYKSDEFLKAYNDNKFLRNLGKVVVIGGGNVAMDVARVAIKMGAEEVKILYRRDEKYMPARKIELEDALKDGVQFIPLTRVVSANYKNKKIESVNCLKTQIVDGKAVDIQNTEFKVEANTVVFAIGLKPEKRVIEKQEIELNDWGMIVVDDNGKTNLDKVFAGGDVTESKATVCKALSAGKRAAMGIINLDK